MQDGAESPQPRKVRKPTPLFVDDLRRFKGFARKLAAGSPAGNKGGRLLEWAASVTDLHRILDVTKSLFLISQSHNEILLRVGLELATSKIAWKIFQWTDGDWYADDAKREWFRDVVQTNLTTVLESAAGERADDERLARANHKVREIQSDLEVAVEKCKVAEALVAQTHEQVQHLERSFQDKSEGLLQTQVSLQEAKAGLEEARANISAIEVKLRESRKEVAVVEAELRDADARCLGLEDDLVKQKAELSGLRAQARGHSDFAQESERLNVSKLKVSEARAQTAEGTQRQMLADLERNAAELETLTAVAETAKSQAAELRSVVDTLQDQVSDLHAEIASKDSSEEHPEIERSLLELNAKFVQLSRENEKLRCQLNSCQTGAKSCESKIRPSTVDGGMQTATSKGAPKRSSSAHKRVTETACEPSESPQLASSLEKTRTSLKKLEVENKQLKKALEGLHNNLKTVVNSCRDSGIAMQVVEIIDKLDLKTQLKGSSVSPVWDRLYIDAMARIDRMDIVRTVSPDRRSMFSSTHSLIEEDEQEHHTKASPLLQVHMSPGEQLESHRSYSDSVHGIDGVCAKACGSSDLALGADLPDAPPICAPRTWSLPPCSASRQVRCASAHRLRASRQASRGRLSSGMSATNGFGHHSDECGAGLSPCRSPSPQKASPKKKVERTVSLPFLHGHKLPSWHDTHCM